MSSQFQHLFEVLYESARLPELAHDRRPRRQGFKTSVIATGTRNPVPAPDSNMADVARRPMRSPLEGSSGDDAGTDTGGNLHKQQIVYVREGERVLAERQDVHVVVDKGRDS